MGSASNYWQFLRLEAGGNLNRKVITPAQDFWQHQFADLSAYADVPDAVVQQELWQLLSSADAATRRMAECCLRCFISAQIELTCVALASMFGQVHGFSSQELFLYVLTDSEPLTSKLQGTGYVPLALEILRTFDPERGANLASWTSRLVKHDRELRQFLIEQGVLLISDWGILNDTSPAQVRRILSEFYPRSEAQIQQACDLLERYHAVYLRDRRTCCQDRRLCTDPSLSQLQEMAQPLPQAVPLETILARLQALAMVLRQHRLQVRSRVFRTQQSLDLRYEDGSLVIDPPAPDQATEEKAEEEEFLVQYCSVFEQYLNQAIAQVTSDRLAQLKSPKDAQWLEALFLLHCQGVKMGAIAAKIGLQAQDAVSRLLKLNGFRTDIRHCLLGLLGDRIQSLAQAYADPMRLQNLDQRLKIALEEQIDSLLDAAKSETNVRNRPLSSLFACRLCHHLDERRTEP
jgi:hypothetical protein